MRCPKCQATMEDVSANEGVVGRCTQCKGLWFEMLQDQDLLKSASAIDTGSAEVGAQFNKIDKINCPVCPSSKLIKMVDSRQPHIWFESCPTCYGRFFDAGEYRDLSKHTIGDFIKLFTVKART